MTMEEGEEEEQSYLHPRISFSLLFLSDEAAVSEPQRDQMFGREDAWTSGCLYSPTTEKLHPQQGEDHGEEEEEEKKADDGLHGAHERHDQVPERGPVSGRRKPDQHRDSRPYETLITQTHLVILKILRSLSALRTLIPNDMPGLKKPQTTSKMLPTMTYKQAKQAKLHKTRGRSCH